MIRMAMTIPPDVLSEFSESAGGGLGFAPAAMISLQDLQVLALMADKNGETLQFRTDLDFGGAESATQMGGMIQGLISLASGFSPDPNVTALLNKLDIDVAGTRLTINFQSTISEFAELSESMREGIAGFSP